MAETKICDNCETEVGQSEETCPKCQANFAELDELASAVERGNKILETRRKRATPAPPVESPKPQTETRTTTSRLRGLGRAFKGKE